MTVVVQAPTGATLTDAGMKRAVAATVARAAKLPDMVGVVDPYQAGAVDRTGTIGLISVQYAKAEDDLTSADRDAFDGLAAEGGAGGLRVVPGGVSGGAPET